MPYPRSPAFTDTFLPRLLTGLRRWLLLALALAAALAAGSPLQAQACSVTREDAVKALYLQVMEREGDPGGVSYYASSLAAGQSVRNIVLGFGQSGEYHARFITGQQDSAVVRNLYRTLLARHPDPGAWAYATHGATYGWNWVVGQLVSSQEYTDRFGDRAVPGDPVVAWDCARAGLALEPANAAPVLERDLCLTVAAGSGAAYECGDLRLAHALPTIRTLNKARTPVLLYNSQHADPQPVVGAYLTLPAGVDRVTGSLVSTSGAVLASREWPAWAPGEERRIALAFKARDKNLGTGVHAYTLQVSVLSGANTVATYSRRGELAVVNRHASLYGAGWWPAGVEEVFVLPDGRRFWVGGDGSHRVYRPMNDGTGRWVAAHATDRPDMLYPSAYPNAAYERRLPGGATVVFAGHGKHIATHNRLDHHTAFGYHSGGQLAWIAVPWQTGYGGQKVHYTFHYAGPGGRLSSITAPDLHGGAGRAVMVGGDAQGRVWSITDPDARAVQFSYGQFNEWWPASRTDRRQTATRFVYDYGGKLASSTVQMQGTGEDITRWFTAQETRGVNGSVPGAQAYTLLDGPRTDVGDTTALWIDRWGAPRRIRNALGHETVLTRGHPRFRALVTHMRAPNGLVTTAEYDTLGYMAATTVHNPLGDGRHARTTYEWDRKWDAPTRIATFEISAAGAATEVVGATSMAYDAATGNRLWQQQGQDSTRRVRFSYYPAGHLRAGQLSRVRTPSDVAHGVPGDSVAYDQWGNLQTQVSTSGIHTHYASDGFGRPWITASPIDASKGLFRRDSVVYDAMGRVEWSISTGPALSNGVANLATGQDWTTPHEQLFVRNTYDEVGNLLAVRRWSVPDTARVATMVTQFEYDRAGRKTAEVAADGARDATEYDAAGNAVAVNTRRGYRITMTHDALNRLRTRSIPGSVDHSREPVDIGYQRSFAAPLWGTDAADNATVRRGAIMLNGDTERFAYDVSGNVVYAANRDAIVRRRYNPNGTISGDTLIIATYATRDTTQHVYGLQYQYDVLGRRTGLAHPSTLAPAGGWTVQNEYDPVTGALTAVTDPVGTHQFDYNIAGQLVGETYGSGVTETFSHDAEGRLWTRKLTIPGMGVLDHDTMHYDQRGKLTYVRQRIGSVTNFYSGLGSLAWSRSSEDNYNYVEQGYVVDALGNTERTEKYDYTKRDYPSVHVTRHTYDAGTARLRGQRVAPGWNADATGGGNMTYDVAGNNTSSSDNRKYHAMPNSHRVEGKASYYDAADRLRIVDMQACAWIPTSTDAGWRDAIGSTTMKCVTMHAGERAAFEEYRYDALGRRVLVRSQEDCLVACIETVTRTVWDGDRVLWEIRAPGANIERDVVPAGQLPPFNITTGRVAYTFGTALDHPLAVHRFDYRDSLFTKYDTVPAPLNMQPLTIYPHTNWRGDYQIGTYVTGETQRCAKVPDQEQDHETVDGSQPGGSTSIYTWRWHCLAPVPWPGKYIWLDHSVRAAPPGSPDLWVGSLVKNKRDLTGNLYMRNRYYDAQAGRFSQEDPIGLAGGLNAYGFAAGDPVTYSDPYGLTSQCIPGRSKLCPIVLAAITVVAATPIDEAVVGTISTAALPVAAVGAFALVIGPEYLRDRAEITPMTPATAVAQQDATMYANAGKGRGGNRAPNAAANWIAGQAGLNREGQRALHDAITGMDYTLDQIREEAARLAEQVKYRIQKPQTEGSDH